MTIQFSFSDAMLCTRLNDLRRAGVSARKDSTSLVLGLLLLIFLNVGISHAQYADLHDFAGSGGAGCCPSYPSVMAQGRDGNVYGITTTGGTSNLGTVFRITPSGGYTQLYSFDGPHGSTPVGGLTLGADGNLYGTAEEGGANGFGSIFKITPAGVYTDIYDFTGNADGGLPVAPLIIGADGNFYSTTHLGVVYKISPTGVFKVVAKIPLESYGPLLLARNGSYYGVTEFAGTLTDGSIYRVTGSTSTVLFNFDGPHGSFPIGGLVEGSDGNLYGTTTAGGTANDGVIFRITPTGTYSVVFNFDHKQPALGYQAYAGLIAGNDGNLYGATIWGGANGNGVIFKMTTGGAYSVLYSFDAPTGVGAYATPIEHTNGKIFGLLKRGGVAGDGAIFDFGAGLPRFVLLNSNVGPVGKTVGILGTGFATASSVTFNGTPASFHVISNTYMTATVPSGETGFVTVTTSSGTLISSKLFKVIPQITGFNPTSGKVGDSITITGAGLIQTSGIKVGTAKVLAYTVNSDGQLTFTVPAGAVSGKILLTTPGGSVTSAATFTVTP
jgi:uncharacterized repeat protein (TIGR03803 family)